MSKEVGEIIRNARMGRRWSQVQMGHHLGLWDSTISNLELGKSDPSAQTLAMLEEEFGTPLVLAILAQVRKEYLSL